MIEVTVNEIEGIRFPAKLKFVKPYKYRHGVRVELIEDYWLERSPEFRAWLKIVKFRKVGRDFSCRADVYVQFPIGYIRYKMAEFLYRGYWGIIQFLYRNARLFQPIPPAQCFSWQYFTPYVWLCNVRNLWQKTIQNQQ